MVLQKPSDRLAALRNGRSLGDGRKSVDELFGDVRRYLLALRPRRQRSIFADERKTQRTAFLLRATSELLEQPLDSGAVIETLARLALPALADGCVVDWIDRDAHDERHRVVRARDAAHDALAIDEARWRLAPMGAGSLPARALATGAPLAVDADGDAPALLVVPLVVRGAAVGAVSLISRDHDYDDDARSLAVELAGRAATALDRALSYERARRAVRLRDDVLAVVSHDLRTPLTTILASTEGLLHRSSDDARPPIERCRRAAQRMRRMTSDLVDAASIEAGTLAVVRGEHDVAAVLQDAIELMQPQADPLAIRLVRDDVHARARCDGERIVQVLGNLVGNAIKFSPTGSEVRLGAEVRDGTVRISVADRGPGIAADALPHIFDRYWRLTDGGNRRGVGLGLYIAKGIIEAHGGQISVDSRVGHGSVFRFTIPGASARSGDAVAN